MKKRIVAFLLTLAMLVGLVPQVMLSALAEELTEAYTLENDFIRVSVSKKNGEAAQSSPPITRQQARLKAMSCQEYFFARGMSPEPNVWPMRMAVALPMEMNTTLNRLDTVLDMFSALMMSRPRME